MKLQPPGPQNVTWFEHRVFIEVKVKSLSHVRLFAIPWIVAPSGSSIHGISQARILEWVAISSSRGSFRPRD